MWTDMNSDFWVGMKTAFYIIKSVHVKWSEKRQIFSVLRRSKTLTPRSGFATSNILSLLVSFLSCNGVYNYLQHNYVMVFRHVRKIVRSDY